MQFKRSFTRDSRLVAPLTVGRRTENGRTDSSRTETETVSRTSTAAPQAGPGRLSVPPSDSNLAKSAAGRRELEMHTSIPFSGLPARCRSEFHVRSGPQRPAEPNRRIRG